LFCELKHLSNNVIIESNEIIRVMASEIIIKTSNVLSSIIGELYAKKDITLSTN